MKEHVEFFNSTARTATSTSSQTVGSKGGTFIIDVSAATATPSVVFTVKGVDPVSGGTITLLTSAAITGAGTTMLRVFPGITVTANISASDILPEGVSITATHADADSITYSVSFVGVN